MTQPGMFAGVNQLQGLHKKFDFPDAATPQLDVVVTLIGALPQSLPDLVLHLF